MKSLTEQFIILCWAVFLLYWIISSFSVKRTVERQGWGWHRVVIVVAVIAAFVLFNRSASLSLAMDMILWPQTLTVGIVADITTLVGLIILLWARTTLGRNWSTNVVFKEQHELIERGPYRYVRHPIYSGLLLMVLGIAIISGRVAGFVVFLAFFIGFWFKALQEERLLSRHFPEAYPNYKARVKALIPFVL
jgi:protein-S-isoprenylcysteine O-methyltransferase Ste14